MKVSPRAASSSARPAAPPAANVVTDDGAAGSFRAQVRRATLAGSKVARLAAARPVAALELAAARHELRERAEKMRAAAGALADDVHSEPGQALALLALLDTDRGLLALRAFCTLVADVRRAHGGGDDGPELGLLLRARILDDGGHLQVPLSRWRSGIRLASLALADYPWGEVRAKVRGEALPALFPLADLWAGVPAQLLGHAWLAGVGGALAEFQSGGHVPDRLRLPLYVAAAELRGRCGLHWLGGALRTSVEAAPPPQPCDASAVVGLGITLPPAKPSPTPLQGAASPPARAAADEEVQQEAAVLFSSQLTLRPRASLPEMTGPKALPWWDDDDTLPPLPASWVLPPAGQAPLAQAASSPAPPSIAPQAVTAPQTPSPASDAAAVAEAELGCVADELVFPTLLPFVARAPETDVTAQADVRLDGPTDAASGPPSVTSPAFDDASRLATSPASPVSPASFASPASAASPASVASPAPRRGRSPTSQARLWSEAPSPRVPAASAAHATASPTPRTPGASPSSYASSPSLSACSLPSSLPMSSRDNSQASHRSGSPLGLASWAAPLRGRSNLVPTQGTRSPRSAEAASTTHSPPVWTPAASSEAGISDEDWAEAAVQPTPGPLGGPVAAVANTALSAAGWSFGVLRGWARVAPEADASRGVRAGVAAGGRASEAAEAPPARAADLVARWRAAAAAPASAPGAHGRAHADLGATLLGYVEAGAEVDERRSRCIEAVGALADDELPAAWVLLSRLPPAVGEGVASLAGARLLRHPPAAIDGGVLALAAAWLRRLGASPSTAATLWHVDAGLDARLAGEALGHLETSMAAWCAEPDLLVPLGRALAAAGEAAPQAPRALWVRAAASGSGGPLVETLRQASVGSPLWQGALTQLALPGTTGSAAALDAIVALAVEKFAGKRNVAAPAKARFERALTALLGRQKRGWSRLDWAQPVAWRLYEVADPAAQASALDAAVAACTAKGAAPSSFLVQATQFVGPGVQLQLAARLVAQNAADVPLAEASAKVVARLHRQQAAAPGTLRRRDAAAVAALAYACGVAPEDWHGRRRDAGLAIWRALNAADFLLAACLASGFASEAAEVVHDALAAPTLRPSCLLGATTALATLAGADGERLGGRLVAAVSVRADEAERQAYEHGEAFPRRRKLPAELQKLAERLSTAGATERREQAWRATAERLVATHKAMRRFVAVLATHVAYHLAREPLPPQTPQGRGAARDWTQAMVGLVEARQRSLSWLGSEPPLQALRERLRAYPDAHAWMDTYLDEALLSAASRTPEEARQRTDRHLATLSAFVDTLPQADAWEFLCRIAPTVYFGHVPYLSARARRSTEEGVHSLRATAWQAVETLLPAYWSAARHSGAQDGYARLTYCQDEVVQQFAAESSVPLQAEHMRRVVDRALRFTEGDAQAQAAAMQGTLDGLRGALMAHTDWSSGEDCIWRLRDVLRLGWSVATRDPARTEFAVELLQTLLLVAHQTPSADQVVQMVGFLLSDEGMGVDAAELPADAARLQARLREAVAPYASDAPPVAPEPYVLALAEGAGDWFAQARYDAWTLAEQAWTETMAPEALAANYLRLVQGFSAGLRPRDAFDKDEMIYVDYAMLDAETRRELLEALLRTGDGPAALNDALLGRMAYTRPLSPSEQALAQRVAGYAGPYANAGQKPLELPPA